MQFQLVNLIALFLAAFLPLVAALPPYPIVNGTELNARAAPSGTAPLSTGTAAPVILNKRAPFKRHQHKPFPSGGFPPFPSGGFPPFPTGSGIPFPTGF
ncbi:MAG: hypothetical protein M1819_001036 [Sarea resinae]|nr:MAG: hypothetical protein M1819_001036 [Sarea resinae]